MHAALEDVRGELKRTMVDSNVVLYLLIFSTMCYGCESIVRVVWNVMRKDE